MASESTKSVSLKQRAASEMEKYLVIALFLSALLVALTAYRRVLMAEVGVSYLHYGYALVEALVLAKIILIGEALHFGDRFEDKPLIVSALYKSLAFGFLALLAHVLEHVIHALVERESPAAALARHPGEIAAYSLVVFVAFVPFFSLQQAGRLLGEERFGHVLLRRPPARSAAP
jgi:hypothetical protein